MALKGSIRGVPNFRVPTNFKLPMINYITLCFLQVWASTIRSWSNWNMTKKKQKSHRNTHQTHIQFFLTNPLALPLAALQTQAKLIDFIIDWVIFFLYLYIHTFQIYAVTLYIYSDVIKWKKIIIFIFFILLKIKRKLRRNVNLYLYSIIFTLPKVIVVITFHQIQLHFIYSTFKIDSITHTLVFG